MGNFIKKFLKFLQNKKKSWGKINIPKTLKQSNYISKNGGRVSSSNIGGVSNMGRNQNYVGKNSGWVGVSSVEGRSTFLGQNSGSFILPQTKSFASEGKDRYDIEISEIKTNIEKLQDIKKDIFQITTLIVGFITIFLTIVISFAVYLLRKISFDGLAKYILLGLLIFDSILLTIWFFWWIFRKI